MNKYVKAIAKKKILLPLGGFLAVALAVAVFLFVQNGNSESPTVSTGLQHLADGAYVAAAAPVGQPVTFSPEFFDTALSGGTVSSVIVTELPPVTEGVLKLGYGTVERGQSIPRESLSYLSFAPETGVRNSRFCFMPQTVDGPCGYVLTCVLSATDSANRAPGRTGAAIAVSTHTGLDAQGVLTASDPEGDALRFEICRYPAHGTISLNTVTGSFSYTPLDAYTGSDSFTWRVQDVHGAYADTAEVSVTVRPLSIGYLYADLPQSDLHNAALRVSAAELMTGETVGGVHYFNPDEPVSRAVFITVLLKAAGVETGEAAETGYADDAKIPAGMKGAIRYAKEHNILPPEENFRPDDPITRAEAAQIASEVLKLATPGYAQTVSDFQSIPVDLADSIYALYEGGYLAVLSDGSLSPAALFTRGDAARFFARILDGKE